MFRKYWILGKVGDAQIILADNLSAVGFIKTGYHAQKRGLSSTIDTDDTDFIPFLDAKRCVLKNNFFTENLMDMFYIDNIHIVSSFPC